MSDMAKVEISQQIVQDIISENIKAGIARAFEGDKGLIEKVVASVLETKVDSSGSASSSSYYKDQTFIRWLADSAIKKAAGEAIQAYFVSQQAEFKKAVLKVLSIKKEQIAEAMIKNLVDCAASNYRININLDQKPKD
jgi:hypothetical protein